MKQQKKVEFKEWNPRAAADSAIQTKVNGLRNHYFYGSSMVKLYHVDGTGANAYIYMILMLEILMYIRSDFVRDDDHCANEQEDGVRCRCALELGEDQHAAQRHIRMVLLLCLEL